MVRIKGTLLKVASAVFMLAVTVRGQEVDRISAYNPEYTVFAIAVKSLKGYVPDIAEFDSVLVNQSGAKLDRLVSGLSRYAGSKTIISGLPASEIADGMPPNGIVIVELSPPYENASVDYRFIKRINSDSFLLLGGREMKRVSLSLTETVDWMNQMWSGRCVPLNYAASSKRHALANEDQGGGSSATLNGNRPKDEAEIPIKVTFLSGESLVVPKVIDLGEVVKSDTDLVFSLKVENTGNSPIRFYGFKGSCKCFKGLIGKETIAPHSVETFTGYLDLSWIRSDERIRSEFAFKSTDSKLPIGVITIVGRFDKSKRVFLEPSRVDFGSVKKSEKKSFTVRVFANTESPSISKADSITLFPTDPDSSFIKVSTLHDAEPSSWGPFVSVKTFQIEFDFANVKPGSSHGTIQLGDAENLFPTVMCRYSFDNKE